MESNVFSIIAPHQTKKYFFSEGVWSLHRRGFPTQFKSNSELSEEHSEKTEVKCPRKKYVTVIQPENFI